jgi:replicative DNA helicase
MAKYSETVLLAHLTNADSLDLLAREGFLAEEALEIIPTELIRRLVRWCLDRFFESGRVVAPSKEAITESWSDDLEAMELKVTDDVETDTVQWAIADLRSFYMQRITGDWTQEFAREVYGAEPQDRVKVALSKQHELVALIDKARSRRNELTGLQGVDRALDSLRVRVDSPLEVRGLTFGLPLLDEHIFGLHDAEICTFAGASGSGKSWFSCYVTNNEFRRGRRTMLVTLENSVEDTWDRLVCMAAGVDYEAWQRAEVTDVQMDMIQAYREAMKLSDWQPIVVALPPEEATPTGIIRRGQLEDVQSIVVDQAAYVHPDAGSRAHKRNEQLAEIMRTFQERLKHEYPVPLLLMSQINREGVAAGRKTGRYYKENLAEGSWMENASDFVFALMQTDFMRSMEHAQIQQLKGRRTRIKHFEGNWRPYVGDIRLKREVSLDGESEGE